MTQALRRFARFNPFVFALLCWLVVAALLAINSLFFSSVRVSVGAVLVPLIVTLFAVGLLARLGWLREAGFRAPEHWRDLRVLWPAALLALIVLLPAAFVLPRVTSLSLAAYGVLIALLAGLNEEAMFRGLLLRILQPYGLLPAAALSALFFGLTHLNNLLLHASLLLTLAQVFWAFLFGFAYAAFRLRTRTIWPLMILHACSDIATNLGIFATGGGTAKSQATLLLLSALLLIALSLALAVYGFFLLRTQAQAEQEAQVASSLPVS
jgi:membrane protease YdiL (CAAX protease family)